MTVYRNAPQTMRDVWTAPNCWADDVYLSYEGERQTFRLVHSQVRRLAFFLASVGVDSGSRVAIAMRNYPEWVKAYWAVVSSGRVAVALNAWWTATECEYALDDSGAEALIVDAERAQLLAHLIRDRRFKTVVVCRDKSPRGTEVGQVTRWDDVMGLDDPGYLPGDEVGPDSVCTILYTSGTTGAPKGAVATHRNHVTNVVNGLLNTAVGKVASGGPKPDRILPNRRDPQQPVALWTFPFFHIAGLTGIAMMGVNGGRLITQYRPDPLEAVELIERETVTILAGVPSVVSRILSSAEASPSAYASLRSIIQGGAPIPPTLISRIEECFDGMVSPSNGYGLTETTSAVIGHAGRSYLDRKDSVGLPLPTTELLVVDTDHREVATGEPGELWVKGPQVARGYWNRPDDTAAAFRDGWFRTGDVARIDGDGYIYVVDRLKDVVVRGGENIYCAEVEARIAEHLAVADVAVFGIEDREFGEVVAACVVVAEGLQPSADELRAFLAPNLAGFKIPSTFVFQKADLPRNAAGKVDKRQLRQMMGARTQGRT